MSNSLQLSVMLLVSGYHGAFQMYPCFYNKQEKGFNKGEVKQRAWKEIAKELDLVKCKVVEQLWNNLKKLLSEQRTKLRSRCIEVCLKRSHDYRVQNYYRLSMIIGSSCSAHF